MHNKKFKSRLVVKSTSHGVEQYLARIARAVMLTLPQASRYTGLDPNTLPNAMGSGGLQAFMYQSQIVATVRDLRRLMKTRRSTNS